MLFHVSFILATCWQPEGFDIFISAVFWINHSHHLVCCNKIARWNLRKFSSAHRYFHIQFLWYFVSLWFSIFHNGISINVRIFCAQFVENYTVNILKKGSLESNEANRRKAKNTGRSVSYGAAVSSYFYRLHINAVQRCACYSNARHDTNIVNT